MATDVEDFEETLEDWNKIMGCALWRLLDDNQGVVVHHREHGYFAAKVWDKKAEDWIIHVTRDDTVLKYPDRDYLTIVPPDEEQDDAETVATD